MNAADQRRLTPVLGVACAVAAAVLVALALGVGRGVRWQAAGQAAALPRASASATAASPPLSQFADVWRHPLFSADRQPAAEDGGGGADVRLGDLELTGIILTPDLRMALLHGPPDQDVRVPEGGSVGDSGWTLVKLEARSAVFERAGQRTELKLKVDAGAPAASAAAPSTPTPVVHPRRRSMNHAAIKAGIGRTQARDPRDGPGRRPMAPSSKQEH